MYVSKYACIFRNDFHKKRWISMIFCRCDGESFGTTCIVFRVIWLINLKNMEKKIFCDNSFLWEFDIGIRMILKFHYSMRRKWHIRKIALNVALWILNLRFWNYLYVSWNFMHMAEKIIHLIYNFYNFKIIRISFLYSFFFHLTIA